jgi:hypothetical protein
MARTPNTPRPLAPPPEILPEAAAHFEAAQDARALAIKQAGERVAALARQLNYEGSTDPAVLENSARDAIRRVGMGLFELGGYLLLLKESCEHGKFLPALERLGIDLRAAQRYMLVTRRFANASSTTHLEAAGVTKLVELLPLDDEQLDDLSELGQTGELQLDDVARLSVKELRAKVRELRHLADDVKADREAKDKVIARLKSQINTDKLEEPAPDEQLEKLLTAVRQAEASASAWVEGHLRQAIEAVMEHNQAHGGNHGAILSGYIAHVEDATDRLRELFGLPRALAISTGGDDDPLGPLTPEQQAELDRVLPPLPVPAQGWPSPADSKTPNGKAGHVHHHGHA